jgi:lipase chaperone LimK
VGSVPETVTNFVRDNGLTAIVVIIMLALLAVVGHQYASRLDEAYGRLSAFEQRLQLYKEQLDSKVNLQELERTKKDVETAKYAWQMQNLEGAQARVGKDIESIRADIQRIQNDLMSYKIASETIKRIDDRMKYLEGRLFGKGTEAIP